MFATAHKSQESGELKTKRMPTKHAASISKSSRPRRAMLELEGGRMPL